MLMHEREKLIIEVGLKQAEEKHINCVSGSTIARELQVSRPLIAAFFARGDILRQALLDVAVERRNYAIIAQALVDPNWRDTVKVDRETKRAALKRLCRIHGIRKLN